MLIILLHFRAHRAWKSSEPADFFPHKQYDKNTVTRLLWTFLFLVDLMAQIGIIQGMIAEFTIHDHLFHHMSIIWPETSVGNKWPF